MEDAHPEENENTNFSSCPNGTHLASEGTLTLSSEFNIITLRAMEDLGYAHDMVLILDGKMRLKLKCAKLSLGSSQVHI